MAYEAILFEKRGHVAILTLNRPDRLNAINPALRAEVHEAVGEAHADDHILAPIVTGAGKGSTPAPTSPASSRRCLSPDSGMSYFLPRSIGYARAADLIFTSRAVDAEEAHRLGLLDRLVARAALIEESVKLAGEMTQ